MAAPNRTPRPPHRTLMVAIIVSMVVAVGCAGDVVERNAAGEEVASGGPAAGEPADGILENDDLSGDMLTAALDPDAPPLPTDPPGEDLNDAPVAFLEGLAPWPVTAARGANGDPRSGATESTCREHDYWDMCFLLVNEAVRLTAIPGDFTQRFPLTVYQFFTGDSNAELGGIADPAYWGQVAPSSSQPWVCKENCAGRLRPNPFEVSAAMNFVRRCDWCPVTTKLFVGSGEAPMSLAQVGAQPYFNAPHKKSANDSACTNGQYLSCAIDTPAGSGWKMVAQYTIANRPLEIIVNNNTATGLVLDGVVGASGLLVDQASSSNTALVGARASGRYAAYRSTDQRSSNFTAEYLVADANGNTAVTACEGCGTRIVISFVESPDGSNTANCSVVNTSNIKKYSCDKRISGSGAAPMTLSITVTAK